MRDELDRDGDLDLVPDRDLDCEEADLEGERCSGHDGRLLARRARCGERL